MAALPIGLIKGHRNVRHERLQITSKKSETTAKIAAIRNKVGGIICFAYCTNVMVHCLLLMSSMKLFLTYTTDFTA